MSEQAFLINVLTHIIAIVIFESKFSNNRFKNFKNEFMDFLCSWEILSWRAKSNDLKRGNIFYAKKYRKKIFKSPTDQSENEIPPIQLIDLSRSLYYKRKAIQKAIITSSLNSKRNSDDAITQLIYYDFLKSITNSETDTSNTRSIVDEILKHKTNKNSKAINIISLFSLIYNILYLSSINIRFEILICTNILTWLILIYSLLILYRIKRGFYGTTYFEAKDIIYYIIKNQNINNNKFNNGKKILNTTTNFVNEAREFIPSPIGQIEYT